MGKKIADFLKGEIVSSIFYILFGACLLAVPGTTINIICKVVFGLVMAGAGVYHIFIYAGEKDNATILDLFTGVIVLVLGVFLFFTPQIIVKILPYLLGAFILVDSIWTLKGAWKLQKLGNMNWKVLLIGSAVFIVLGVVVLIGPFAKVTETAMFAGGVMLANGLCDLVCLVFLRKGIRKAAVEQTAIEESKKKAVEMPEVPKKTPDKPKEKPEKRFGGFFAKKNKVPETDPDYVEDESENEENLPNETIINGRWKTAAEEVSSPEKEIQELVDAKREAEKAIDTEEEFTDESNTVTEEGKDEEPAEEPAQEEASEKEEEVLEEWVD